MEESNDIVFRARMEGASSVVQDLSSISRAAESAGNRMRDAFSNATRMNFGGIGQRLSGLSTTRLNVNPQDQSSYLRSLDQSRRQSLRQQFFAQRIIGLHPSTALQNLMSQGGRQLLLGYNPSINNLRQDDANGMFRNIMGSRIAALRERFSNNRYRWLFTDYPDDPERRDEIRRRISGRYATAPETSSGQNADRESFASRFWNGLQNARGRRGQSEFLSRTGHSLMARGGVAGYLAGGMMRVAGGLMSAAIPILALGWITKKLVGMMKRVFNVFKTIAEENFNLFKQSAISSILSPSGGAGELNAQWRMMRMLGGDAASASALNAKIATSRAMLAYGGSGGAFMEAARLFGVNIGGSGKYGLATNKEFLASVARRMGQLDPESQIALANVVGLTKEQFWAMRGGEGAWNRRIEASRTFLDRIYGEESQFSTASDSMRETSEDFIRSWGEFINAMKEFGLVIGMHVLPSLRFLLKILTTFVEGLNAAIAPYTKTYGWMASKLGDAFDFTKISDRIPNPERTRDEYVRSLDERSFSSTNVNISSINITSSEPISDSSATDLGRSFGTEIGLQLGAA